MELTQDTLWAFCIVFFVVGMCFGYALFYLGQKYDERKEPERIYIFPKHNGPLTMNEMRSIRNNFYKRMNMNPNTYPIFTRVAFEIEAVQVTAENMTDVSAWCEGEIMISANEPEHIKVDVTRPLHKKQTQAFIGDWVLKSETGYKVYTDKAFRACFEPKVTLPSTTSAL